MKRLHFSDSDFWQEIKAFCQQALPSADIEKGVKEILQAVVNHGDKALIDWTAKIDGTTLTSKSLRITKEQLRTSAEKLSKEDSVSIKEAIHCIETFHQKGIPQSWEGNNPHGALVGEYYYPLERVGIWIPGGNVPLVSTVIMTTVLARLAKVKEIAVFTPPGPDGTVNQALLATLHLCEITEVYCIGGVMAIGAMAYGTEAVPSVCKIFGPGNVYLMEAKRQVFGIVGIDLLPGPSEVMVLADETAQANLVAADLLSQAEHGSGKEKIYLVTSHPPLIDAVEKQINKQLQTLSHQQKIKIGLDKGFLIITTNNLDQAVKVANFIAPEHLELHVASSLYSKLLKEIYNAGAILIGEQTPTVLGDFTAGPSHTLPTGRTGRFFSGLRITDFFRRTSIIKYDSAALAKAAPVVSTFSRLENLDAHGRSLEMRLGDKNEE